MNWPEIKKKWPKCIESPGLGSIYIPTCYYYWHYFISKSLFPLIFRALLRSVAMLRQDIPELRQKYKNGEMLCTLQWSLLGRPRGLGTLTRQRVSLKLTSWNFGVFITRIFLPYPRISLVYGSTCSPLVLSYYKCPFRLNSDIVKPLPVFHCPRKTLKPTTWNSVGIQ